MGSRRMKRVQVYTGEEIILILGKQILENMKHESAVGMGQTCPSVVFSWWERQSMN